VESMMVNAVENGSITNARVDGYVVGGKTGTAEIGNDTSHSLFIGFIGNPEPRYAVSVVLEEGSGGLTSAVAIGRDILLSTIQRYPEGTATIPQEAAYVRSQNGRWIMGKSPQIW
jgi:penicillin-binding protein A